MYVRCKGVAGDGAPIVTNRQKEESGLGSAKNSIGSDTFGCNLYKNPLVNGSERTWRAVHSLAIASRNLL